MKTNSVFDISVTNVFRISGTLNEPGFLRLALPKAKDRRKDPADFSVGFDFYLLGLNRHFTKGALFVPAITDTMGCLAGRRSGWPRIVEVQKTEDKKAAERNARQMR